MGILEDIFARLERIEIAVGTGAQPAETPAATVASPTTEQPGYGPPPTQLAPATEQPSYGPPAATQPAYGPPPANPVPQPTYGPPPANPVPQPTYGPPATQPTTVTGPAVVPTFQELYERLMDLNQAKGEMACLDLLRVHGGQDAQGSVNLKQVPQGEYAALYAAITNQLQAGAH